MMGRAEIEKRFAEINAREPEEASAADLAAIAAAEHEEGVDFEDFRESLEGYSGRLVLRIPKSLHRTLKKEAEAEGVSLNQYMLYKLAR